MALIDFRVCLKHFLNFLRICRDENENCEIRIQVDTSPKTMLWKCWKMISGMLCNTYINICYQVLFGIDAKIAITISYRIHIIT